MAIEDVDIFTEEETVVNPSTAGQELELPTSTTNVGMLKTMEPTQTWIEENIGEDKEVLGSRTLHTLGKERLFTAPSSGINTPYAAEIFPYSRTWILFPVVYTMF